jgi:2-aminoadipate transaminase
MSSELATTPGGRFEPRWARRAAAAGNVPFGGERAALSLAYGFPDPALFPYAELAVAAGRVLHDPSKGAAALQYGKLQGVPSLLSMLASKLSHDEGLTIQPDSLLITGGSSGAIGLAARSLVDEGDTVLVEAPSFTGAMNMFRRTGAELRSLPMGPDGIDVAGAEAALDALHIRGIRPRVLYTMPTFHNPTGLTLSEAQRGALLGMARRYNLIVIEDDAYRDLYYDGQQGALPQSLYALDREGRVIRTGTFSKILAPGLRLGWALAQPEIINKMLLLKEEGASTPFAQQVVVEYGRDGVLMSHIAMLVDAYRQKRDTMLDALERFFPAEASWTRPAGGFYVWVTLPASVDPAALASHAREEGVDYVRGESCYCEQPSQPGTRLRLCFSMLRLDDIEEAVKRLGHAIYSFM